MSTRCNTHFTQYGATEANVYVHSDGYPDGEHGIPQRFGRFCRDLEEQTTDTRYGDPAFLAAKFLVWVAGQYANDPRKPLEFLSVGIMTKDAGDAAYVYTVDCTSQQRPPVTWTEPARTF